MKTVSRKRREVNEKSFVSFAWNNQFFLPFNKSTPPFSNRFFFILNFNYNFGKNKINDDETIFSINDNSNSVLCFQYFFAGTGN